MDMNMLNKTLTISVYLNSFKCKIKLKRGMLVQGNKPRETVIKTYLAHKSIPSICIFEIQ